MGTPQELTDNDGNIIWANYEYAWGGTYQNYYKERSINGIVIYKDELQPLKFQGQYYDPETSLHYNRFCYYDSDVGMFIQRDPIGLLGGYNVFAYASNPVGWIRWGWLVKHLMVIKQMILIDTVIYIQKRTGQKVILIQKMTIKFRAITPFCYLQR